MALTESQKLALKRITNMYPSANKSVIRDAMNQGMSVTKIKQMLGKPSDDAKVKAATQKVKGALAKPAAKASTGGRNKGGQKAVDALASIRSTLAKPTDRNNKSNRSTAAGGRTAKEAASANMAPPVKATPKAKKYNVGVSKGGVPFKEAFAHFRKKGNKTFTWNGTKYTTELAKPKGKK